MNKSTKIRNNKNKNISLKAFVGLDEHKKKCGEILKKPQLTTLSCISHITV